MTDMDKLQVIIDECDAHAERLSDAYQEVLPLFPMDEVRFAGLTKTQLSFLDQLVYRFSKLQDALGAKLFPLLVGLLQQNVEKLTFIDILNRLEKADLLPSAREWQDMREFRNHLTHEYPGNPELKISNLNASVKTVRGLLDYWQALRVKVLTIKNQS